MSVSLQLTNFGIFFILGIIISCIFDIFRTLRKIKKKNSIYVVMIQDIIFFIIITIISVIYLLVILREEVRAYMFIGAVSGILFSRKIISKYLMSIYYKIYIMFRDFFLFIIQTPYQACITNLIQSFKTYYWSPNNLFHNKTFKNN